MSLADKSVSKSDSSLGSAWSLRPGSFTALMALYESNFLRLNWLLDDIDSLRGEYVSTTDNDFPLFLSVTDVSRYTTSITEFCGASKRIMALSLAGAGQGT